MPSRRGPKRNSSETRYRRLLKALETAERELRESLPPAAGEARRQAALRRFLQEIIRLTRLEVKLFGHPIVVRWIGLARAFGWRGFLEQLPPDQRRGVSYRPSPQDLALLHEVDALRWQERPAEDPTASAPRRTGNPREARHRNLRKALETAERDFRESLAPTASEARQQGALGDFLEEMIRLTRLDSMLLRHPIVVRWIGLARAFGWRRFLEQLPNGQRRGVSRPLSPREIALLHAVDALRWRDRPIVAGSLEGTATPFGVQVASLKTRGWTEGMIQATLRDHGTTGAESLTGQPLLAALRQRRSEKTPLPAAGTSRPVRSLRNIYSILKRIPKTRHLLERKGGGETMSYQAFHDLVADGLGKGRQVGKLRL